MIVKFARNLALGMGALALLGACDRLLGPSTWEAAMAAAATHAKAGQFDKVVKDCQRALEIADKVGNGQRSLTALDCIAEMSGRIGKPEIALPHYASVLTTYDTDLRNWAGRFRIRNNYAVTQFLAGRKADAIRTFSDTLDAWDGTPYSTGTPDAFTTRMLIVRNLARAARSDQGGAVAEWLVATEADDILANFERTANNGVHLAMNGADALAEISTLASSRGEMQRATMLREAAEERRAEEEPLAASHPAIRRMCMEAGTQAMPFQGCFQKIP